MEEPDPERGSVLQGTVVDLSTQEEHPEASSTTPGTVAVQVAFTKSEAMLEKKTVGGIEEVHCVGEKSTNSRRWMAASEAALYTKTKHERWRHGCSINGR
jgi:hypothetical protein